MAHLQEAAVKQITEICDRYKDEETPLMMILSDIQKEDRHFRCRDLRCSYFLFILFFKAERKVCSWLLFRYGMLCQGGTAGHR